MCDAACRGCWSTGASFCQFCKTYKLDEACVERCGEELNATINGKHVFLRNKETRECQYCHDECAGGCRGPADTDCVACAHYKLPLDDATTTYKCVRTCPITHYAESGTNRCLPCYKDCYGCTGPGNRIGPGGCTKCSSALVDNDPAYSLLQCIVLDEYACNGQHFTDLVSENVADGRHPLRGKTVCRRCNAECDKCYKSGVQLKSECEACRNYYSLTSNKCVTNCSAHNEYVEKGTKVIISHSLQVI